MIKAIKLNKFIDKVGIEFEGSFSRSFYDECCSKSTETTKKCVLARHSDCSVNALTYAEHDMYQCEIVTRALKGKRLTEILRLFDEKFSADEYSINESCGLHFHVSLKKNYYAYIDNQEFYDAFIDMFKTNFPDVWRERSQKSYCKVNHQDQHFTLSSKDRYAAVNYCYRKHHTVEFRLYGGSHGTIEGLAKVIDLTLKLIQSFIEDKDKTPKKIPYGIYADLNDREENAKQLKYDITSNPKNRNLKLEVGEPGESNRVNNLQVDISY